MNKIKIVLYALLGVVSFSLWNAWQKDNPVNAQPQTAQTTISQTANVTPAISSVTPSTASTSISQPQNILPTTDSKQISKVSEDQIIRVKTDVLDIAIDTVGGNIINGNLLQYKKTLDSSDTVQILNDAPDNLYVAESGLVSELGPDNVTKQAKFSTEKKNYVLEPNQKELPVTLTWKNKKGLSVNKTFIFTKDSYDIKIDYDIDNKTKQLWTGQFYAQIKHKYIPVSKSFFKYSTFTGFAISSPDKPYQKLSYDKLTSEKIDKDIQGGWLALQQQYFLSAWVPDKSKTYHYFSDVAPGDIYTAGFIDNAVSVPAGTSLKLSSNFYV